MKPIEWLVGVCLVGLCIGWICLRWMRGQSLLPRAWRGREGFQTTVVPLEGGDENARKNMTEAERLAYDMLQIARMKECPTFILTTTDVEEKAEITKQATAYEDHIKKYAPAIRTRFWNYVSRLNPDAENSMWPEIRAVMTPQPDDTYQVTFPLYMSIFALATATRNPESSETNPPCARVALFDNYMLLQKKLTETVYDTAMIGKWDADPKAQSCASLQVAEGNLKEALALLRSRVQDVSGMTFTLANLRDENLDFQKRFQAACTNALSDQCKQLASQEPILFPLLAEFEGVSSTGYEKEEDINEVLGTFGALYSLLGCTNVSGTKFTFSADEDVGTIDAESLRMKLQTLSPYYVSPDTMKYITDLLISPDDVQDELMRTSDVFAKINTTMGGIKRLSGLAA